MVALELGVVVSPFVPAARFSWRPLSAVTRAPGRSPCAYSATLQLATVVLAASGYRAVAQRGYHAVTLRALPAIMGDSVRDLAVCLDSCPSLHNRGDYDRVGVVSASDVTELLDETAVFRQQVLGWLSETHPELLADR